jgi:hypothetical protein
VAGDRHHRHDASHVRPLPPLPPTPERELGVAVAEQLLADKAIIGVFDEGCMGMYNAIIDDELLNPLGIYKERLSQSALWAEMQQVRDEEAAEVGAWLAAAGMTFRTGTDEATELTEAQLTWQYKMYIAALRISDDFGLDAVGIQYQQGLKDLAPASDLVEGLLNNVERPPVRSRDGARILYDGSALTHFNEVDEGVAVDAVITHRVWNGMGLDPANTLHDVRWGEEYDGQFVWVFEISGSVPASHLIGGYAGATGYRQGPVYFPAGGSTLCGISKPGEIVWSRVYIADGVLNLDIGRATVVELPLARPSVAGRPPPPAGRSPTSCCTASRATSSWPGTRRTTPRSSTPRTRPPPTPPCWPRQPPSTASACGCTCAETWPSTRPTSPGRAAGRAGHRDLAVPTIDEVAGRDAQPAGASRRRCGRAPPVRRQVPAGESAGCSGQRHQPTQQQDVDRLLPGGIVRPAVGFARRAQPAAALTCAVSRAGRGRPSRSAPARARR